MKYSYEYKRMCVEMYREGKWPETPEGIQERNFYKIICKWFRMEESCGPDALRHKKQSKVWTVEEKHEPVAKVLAGASYKDFPSRGSLCVLPLLRMKFGGRGMPPPLAGLP